MKMISLKEEKEWHEFLKCESQVKTNQNERVSTFLIAYKFVRKKQLKDLVTDKFLIFRLVAINYKFLLITRSKSMGIEKYDMKTLTLNLTFEWSF